MSAVGERDIKRDAKYSKKPTASELCGRALSGKHISSAELTTVGTVRQWQIGPAARPARHAFGSGSDDAPAA